MLIMSASPEGFKRWLDIAKILLQGRELAGSNLMTVAVAVVSPLTLTEFNGDLLISACENGFPIFPTICPMSGATSPYTIASTMLLGNTENMFMAAMSQIINPGNPFMYTFGPSVSNLKSAHELYTTMEKILWKTAQVQLAKSYNLPNSAECGGSLTYRYDQQNGAEGILSMLSAQATGTDVLTGIGSSMNAAGMSAEMMIIQSAWLEAAKFLSKGMTVDDTHLAVERIKQSGPGSNFLMDDLTLEYMHGGEFFMSDIFDYPLGFDNGDSLLTRAHNKVEELTSDCDSPHPHQVQEALLRYFRNQGLQPL
jgi:trimethylamine---corrinoid protein Co-methyltransferase